jgi:hypothetical protein
MLASNRVGVLVRVFPGGISRAAYYFHSASQRIDVKATALLSNRACNFVQRPHIGFLLFSLLLHPDAKVIRNLSFTFMQRPSFGCALPHRVS